jgi:tRNA (guanine-N7-)-methyltransferase
MPVQTPPADATPILITPPSYVERLNLAACFPRPQPIEVELGAGDGSFLIEWAEQNPHTNFLGVERLWGRLKKIEKRARRGGLENVRGLRLEAAYFAEYLISRESVAAFHIYFPDPWPKRKHRQNRLINAAFTEVLRAALQPGGVVYLRTDDRDYFEQMTEVFGANANFAQMETPGRLAAVRTDFEREFNAQGIATNRAAYRRVP